MKTFYEEEDYSEGGDGAEAISPGKRISREFGGSKFSAQCLLKCPNPLPQSTTHFLPVFFLIEKLDILENLINAAVSHFLQSHPGLVP